MRCVEVTLGGWDTHVNNHEIHTGSCQECSTRRSPPCCATWRGGNCSTGPSSCAAASSAARPRSTRLGGRDHWPGGFSLALAGGGLRGGAGDRRRPIPKGSRTPSGRPRSRTCTRPCSRPSASNPAKENIAPATGRPIKLSAGKPIRELLG